MKRVQFRPTPYLSVEIARRTGSECSDSKAARTMAERYARLVEYHLPFFSGDERRFSVDAKIPCDSPLAPHEWPAWVAYEAKRDGLPGSIDGTAFLDRLEALTYIQRISGHDFCEIFWASQAKGLNPILPGEARLAQ